MVITEHWWKQFTLFAIFGKISCLNQLKHILAHDMLPFYIVDEEIKSYLNNKTEPSKLIFYTLPHITDISEKTNKNICIICEEFCTDTRSRLSFTTFKIGCMFSVRWKLVDAMESFVIYCLTFSVKSSDIYL